MKMMEMTGEIADGVCLNYLVNPKYNAEAMDALEREPRRPAAPSTTSIGRNWSSARWTTTASTPWTWPAR
jgi:hypothetical protein